MGLCMCVHEYVCACAPVYSCMCHAIHVLTHVHFRIVTCADAMNMHPCLRTHIFVVLTYQMRECMELCVLCYLPKRYPLWARRPHEALQRHS